jgi:hypothetical protein
MSDKRPFIELELGLVGNNSTIKLNGEDVSNWITRVEVEAAPGDLTTVKLTILPEEVRVKVNDERNVKFVCTGPDGEKEVEALQTIWELETGGRVDL